MRKTARMTDKSLNDALKEQLSQLKTPNIAIIGRTGVGKSTLINKVFGVDLAIVGAGLPVTKGFRRYPPKNSDNIFPLVIYDSAGYEATKEQEFLTKVSDFIEERQQQGKGFEEQIHFVWYVINAASARVEDFDKEVLDKINEKNIPAIIVLSQCDRAKDDELDGVKDALAKYKFNKVWNIIEVSADPLVVRGKPLFEPFGLQELVNKTIDKLPEACTEAFIAAQIIDLQAKRKIAWTAIFTAATACFTGSVFPVPGSTPIALLASQAGLFVRIAYIYEYKEDAQFLLTILTPTISSVGTLLSSIIGDLISIFFPPALPIAASGMATYIVAFGLACTTIFENMARNNIYGKGKDAVKKYLEENLKPELAKYKDLKINSPEALKNIAITFLNPPL